MNRTSSGNSVSFVFLFRVFLEEKCDIWEEQRFSMTKNVISIRNLIKSMWFLLLSKCRSLIRSKNSDETMASIDKCVKNKASERASKRTNERARRRPRKKRGKKCEAFHKVQFSQCLFDGKISFSFNFRKSCLKIDSLWFYLSVTFCFSLLLDNLRSFFKQSEQIFFFFFKVNVFICHSFRSDLLCDLLLVRWFTMMTVMFD